MTARGFVALALLAALAACNTPSRQIQDITAADQSPLDRECRQEAVRQSNRDRELGRQANVENPANIMRLNEMRRDDEEAAFRDCLRRRGAPMPGGVERVRLPTGFVWR